MSKRSYMIHALHLSYSRWVPLYHRKYLANPTHSNSSEVRLVCANLSMPDMYCSTLLHPPTPPPTPLPTKHKHLWKHNTHWKSTPKPFTWGKSLMYRKTIQMHNLLCSGNTKTYQYHTEAWLSMAQWVQIWTLMAQRVQTLKAQSVQTLTLTVQSVQTLTLMAQCPNPNGPVSKP